MANPVKKFYLKVFNRSKYIEYKEYLKKLDEEKNDALLMKKQEEARTELRKHLELINNARKTHLPVTFCHSGNAGDIIYALPLIKRIHEICESEITLLIKPGWPIINKPEGFIHPLGNVLMSEKMAGLLIPLIKHQSYISDCSIYQNETVDINLDAFRIGGFPLSTGNIARWCNYITGINTNLSRQWIIATPKELLKDTIIVARSQRYRNTSIDYSFLKKYPKLAFVGVKEEFDDMKKFIPGIQWIQVTNFLDLANVIAGCKFFIGNQSLPFAIAEGLKIPRILEIYAKSPDVIPEGSNGYDYYFQEHFEWLVSSLNEGVL